MKVEVDIAHVGPPMRCRPPRQPLPPGSLSSHHAILRALLLNEWRKGVLPGSSGKP